MTQRRSRSPEHATAPAVSLLRARTCISPDTKRRGEITVPRLHGQNKHSMYPGTRQVQTQSCGYSATARKSRERAALCVVTAMANNARTVLCAHDTQSQDHKVTYGLCLLSLPFQVTPTFLCTGRVIQTPVRGCSLGIGYSTSAFVRFH